MAIAAPLAMATGEKNSAIATKKEDRSRSIRDRR